MSRSPTAQSSAEERAAYTAAWQALHTLLKQGKSESGNERNCCFLNLQATDDPGRKRFATISAATATDFPDDARGLALCDWDCDGRIDFWITNRTAPRVRLMLNRYPSADQHWLAVKPAGNGKGTNRDAIGARVEVFLKGLGQPLLRTVNAGAGFLSQSSLWQHFGLGRAQGIEKIVVRWPGGLAETFAGAEMDRFYRLEQGTGQLRTWTVPDMTLANGSRPALPVPEDSESARLVMLAALPLPADFVPMEPGTGGLLLNLWSATCPNCLAELRAWGPELSKWEARGLAVASWCLDADDAGAQAVARKQGYGGRILTTAKAGHGGLSADLLLTLNAVQRGCFGLQADLPVPASFLLDRHRRLVAIYKGPVNPGQIGADLSLGGLTHGERIRAASPDKSGRWHEPLMALGVRGAVASLLETGLKPQAEELLQTCADWHGREADTTDNSAELWRRTELRNARNLLALLSMERQDWAGAERHFLASLAVFPDIEAHRGLVKLYTGAKNPQLYPRLAEHLEAVVKADPNPADLAKLGVLKLELGDAAKAAALLRESTAQQPDATNFFQLGQACLASGQAGEAAAAWQRALQLKPDFLPALSNLAWLRATHADASLRDGATALQLAERAAELSQGRNHLILGILTAAQAETGDFATAVKTAATARQLAQTAGDAAWAGRLSQWIGQFEAKQPVREK
ncbi:MAG: ASPIC/UnbV domain-containing protein [Verrucomicrobiales bacterium]|nr:ASPIC/UnbV domain-containing protein [Verrucomicrobiales bacterium]